MSFSWPSWVGVISEDLERQRAFYRDVLGFRETDSGEGWIHFEVPGGGLFELIQREDLPQYDRPRYQVGFTVEDIGEARARLIENGAEPLSEIEGAGSTNLWCYFRDPEGNVFEITQWLKR